jgi:hypothetical protein
MVNNGQLDHAAEQRRERFPLTSALRRASFASRWSIVEACIGLGVPGRPIRYLVAEDRSAGGVRDRTGSEPAVAHWCWFVVGPHGIGKRRSWAGTSGHDG